MYVSLWKKKKTGPATTISYVIYKLGVCVGGCARLKNCSSLFIIYHCSVKFQKINFSYMLDTLAAFTNCNITAASFCLNYGKLNAHSLTNNKRLSRCIQQLISCPSNMTLFLGSQMTDLVRGIWTRHTNMGSDFRSQFNIQLHATFETFRHRKWMKSSILITN